MSDHPGTKTHDVRRRTGNRTTENIRAREQGNKQRADLRQHKAEREPETEVNLAGVISRRKEQSSELIAPKRSEVTST
jgi:hypothetical protein